MLKKLSISNFAIIEELSLELDNGFIVITGETGAGKSIIFDAIELLLGGRANHDMIRFGTKSARIEGVFSVGAHQRARIEAVLEEYGCPIDDELHIRRVLAEKGRSKVFINGSMSSLRALQEIAQGFVDVISQHASHQLMQPEEHLSLVDMFAKTQEESQKLSGDIASWRTLQRSLQKLENQESKRQKRLEQIAQQLDEIDCAGVSLGEDTRIETELERLLNIEVLREKTTSVSYMLRDAEGSVLDQLSTAIEQLRRVAYLEEDLENCLESLEKCSIEMSECARDVRQVSENASSSPEDIEMLQERLELMNRLKRQHGGTVEGVLAAVEQLAKESEELSNQSAQIQPLRVECHEHAQKLINRAKKLSTKRKKESLRLAQQVESELKLLGMPHCRFKIAYSRNDEEMESVDESMLTADGFDAVTFLISPNPGEGFKDLARIASGGELSRLLLAIKSAIIENDPVETYIFDEVDTGISGATAQIVGQKMQSVGSKRQALCITHLAQVAACAHQHLFVSKSVDGDRTSSQLRFLTTQERIEEIARMLGGVDITDRTRAHAQELLEENSTITPVLSIVS